MNFVLLAPILDKTLGQTFLMLAVSTDTCLTAIVIGLFIVMSKKYHTRDIRKLANLDFSDTQAHNKETD
jgi:NADH:ubiquinone oxidoreductase subunit K